MQYNVNSVEEYLQAIDRDWRFDIIQILREYILNKLPILEESIEYGMLRYGTAEDSVFYIQAQKQHVGFYVGDVKVIDPQGNILKSRDHGKGCVRIRKSTNLDELGLFDFIQEAFRLWKSGVAMGC